MKVGRNSEKYRAIRCSTNKNVRYATAPVKIDLIRVSLRENIYLKSVKKNKNRANTNLHGRILQPSFPSLIHPRATAQKGA